MNKLISRLLSFSEKLPQPIGKIFRFYIEGFSEMTVGRKLWGIILLKLFIMFFIFKLFLFPNILHRDYDTDEQRAEAVRTVMTER